MALSTSATAPPERSFERLDVDVVQQRREPGLARPFGRVVHPDEMIWKIGPTLCSVPQFLVRAPHQSRPSLRSTRCLRRHPRCQVGGGALSDLGAYLRPPLKLDVQFSRIQLSWIGLRSLKRRYQRD